MGSPYGAIDFFWGGFATERLSLRDIFGGQDDFIYVFFLNPRGVQAL